MYGKFIDTDMNTLIGDLPSIINANNSVIEKEFDYIYDSSNNYVKQSLVAEKGRVKAHWGEFINLKTNNLIVDGIISGKAIDNLLKGSLDTLGSHLQLSKRFSWDPNAAPSDSSISTYAHDTGMIVTASLPIKMDWLSGYSIPSGTTVNLRTELNYIEETIGKLVEVVNVKDHDNNDESWDDSNSNDDTVASAYDSATSTLDNILVRLSDIEARLNALEQN